MVHGRSPWGAAPRLRPSPTTRWRRRGTPAPPSSAMTRFITSPSVEERQRCASVGEGSMKPAISRDRARSCETRAPPFGRFSARTLPPCASAMTRTIARPSPEPSRSPSLAVLPADERLERPGEHLGRESAARILDGQVDRAVVDDARHPHAPSGGDVAQRVVEEIVQGLAEPRDVHTDRRPPGRRRRARPPPRPPRADAARRSFRATPADRSSHRGRGDGRRGIGRAPTGPRRAARGDRSRPTRSGSPSVSSSDVRGRASARSSSAFRIDSGVRSS